MNTVRHVADADDVRLPFDWTEHEEGAECWCVPEQMHDLKHHEIAMYVHRRPIEYGIDGVARVVERW